MRAFTDSPVYDEPSSFQERLRNLYSGSITPESLVFELLTTHVFSIATFGGLVVVSKMIMQEEVCMKI
ncbi:hypothetical protein P167DRAFT_539541 [Morchella conica CCBAS932]|uniref:Uncharacterized protein n=1 Tax=Morchella conica CCBAS932 TaxID=1392247 RepID=A0A3N4KFI2_9PEZI|nr:hypothetical protein P167DRAFT_539541 [Morchella conica CCBAS932]